jgi:glycosyltransferase involved in cell wall biosynthesis
VLVPCLDEAATIGDVVAGFRASLPGCVVHVYDNGSTDDTARLAADAGAVSSVEPLS